MQHVSPRVTWTKSMPRAVVMCPFFHPPSDTLAHAGSSCHHAISKHGMRRQHTTECGRYGRLCVVVLVRDAPACCACSCSLMQSLGAISRRCRTILPPRLLLSSVHRPLPSWGLLQSGRVSAGASGCWSSTFSWATSLSRASALWPAAILSRPPALRATAVRLCPTGRSRRGTGGWGCTDGRRSRPDGRLAGGVYAGR
jgi:hypothetical protein